METRSPGGGCARGARKTLIQRESLEAAYAIKPNPTLGERRALAERIDLTEQQVQAWFTHKRRQQTKTNLAAAIPHAQAEQAAKAAVPSPSRSNRATASKGAGGASAVAAADTAGTVRDQEAGQAAPAVAEQGGSGVSQQQEAPSAVQQDVAQPRMAQGMVPAASAAQGHQQQQVQAVQAQQQQAQAGQVQQQQVQAAQAGKQQVQAAQVQQQQVQAAQAQQQQVQAAQAQQQQVQAAQAQQQQVQAAHAGKQQAQAGQVQQQAQAGQVQQQAAQVQPAQSGQAQQQPPLLAQWAPQGPSVPAVPVAPQQAGLPGLQHAGQPAQAASATAAGIVQGGQARLPGSAALPVLPPVLPTVPQSLAARPQTGVLQHSVPAQSQPQPGHAVLRPAAVPVQQEQPAGNVARPAAPYNPTVAHLATLQAAQAAIAAGRGMQGQQLNHASLAYLLSIAQQHRQGAPPLPPQQPQPPRPAPQPHMQRGPATLARPTGPTGQQAMPSVPLASLLAAHQQQQAGGRPMAALAGYPALALLQQAQQRQVHQQQHPPQAVSTAPGAFRLYGQPLLGAQDHLGQKRKAGEPGSADLPEAKRMAMQPPGQPQGSLAQALPHQVAWHPRPQAYPAAMQPGLQMAGQDPQRMALHLEQERQRRNAFAVREADRLRAQMERDARRAQERADREAKAEEKRKQQEDKKREKETLKAMAAQERQAMRLRDRAEKGVKDDLDIEWAALVEQHREAGYGSGTEGTNGAPSEPTRPPFPPPELRLGETFPPGLGPRNGGGLLAIWDFVNRFGDVLGLWPCTLDELLSAVVQGGGSRLLGEIHIALLRLLQVDMEEAHGVTGAMQTGGPSNFMDRAIVNCAAILDEAWAWSFDVDVWRAHLNVQTWPEVLRELATSAGLGRKRPKLKRDDKDKLGTEGEDIIADEAGSLKLRLPARLGHGTVKSAAWLVLAEAGPQGLSIADIAKQIHKRRLRDLTTSRTPEASVAGALARDILFDRVAPSTFALQAIVNHQRLATGGLAPAATNPGTSEVAVEADAAAEHHPAAAAPLPVMMEPAAPEGGSQQTAPLSPKAEPAMPPQQQVPESDQQTALPSPKVEPGMPHLQQQQQPVQQGATAAGTPAVKQEDPRAAMAAGDEGARISPLAPKQESQDVHGHGGLAAGAVTAAAACQGSGRPKAAEQLASAKQAAEVVDEDDEPEEEEEEESNGKQGEGRSWARDLELHEYAHLSVEQRLDALLALVHLAADSPSIRSAIELRIEEAHRMKRVLADEAKTDKKRKVHEASSRSRPVTANQHGQVVSGAPASIQTQGSAIQSQHSGLQPPGSGAVPLHQQQAVTASANLQQQPVHLQSTPQAPSEAAPLQAGPAQQQLSLPQMGTSLASSTVPAHTQAAGPSSVVIGVPSTTPSAVPAAPVGAAGAVLPAQAAGPMPGAMLSGAAGAQQPVGQPAGPPHPQLQQQHQQQMQGPGETWPKAADWHPVSDPASNGNNFNVATILQQQPGMHRPAAASKAAAVHRNVHGDMARRLALAAAAAAARIRQRQKAESLRRAEDATAVRAEPLGQDRRFNRYWQFVAGGEDCPAAGAGRIFVEPHDGAGFLLLSEPQQLSLLLDSLETRGPREKALYDALLRHKDCMISNMPGQPLEMPEGVSPEQQEEGELWLHTSHLQADAVRPGHLTVPLALAQGQGLSPLAKLRADMVRVQAAVPAKALAQDFDREAWQQQVQAAEKVVQLRQALAMLEGALSEEWLSPLFQRTPRHHRGSDRAQSRSVTPKVKAGGQAGASEASAALSALPAAPQSEDEPMPEADADQPVKAEPGMQSQGPLHGSSAAPGSSSVADSGVDAAAPLHSPAASAEPDQEAAATAAPAQEGPDGAAAPAELNPVVQPGFQVEVEEPLGWVPPTCAAVSLRLFALDAALVYQPGQPPARERHQAYHYMQRPAPILSTMGLHGPGGDFRMLDPAGRMVSGAPIALGSGRMKAVLFPSFAAPLHGPRQTFTLPLVQLRASMSNVNAEEVAAQNRMRAQHAAIVAAATPARRGQQPPGLRSAGPSTRKPATRSKSRAGSGKRKSASRQASGDWGRGSPPDSEDEGLHPSDRLGSESEPEISS